MSMREQDLKKLPAWAQKQIKEQLEGRGCPARKTVQVPSKGRLRENLGHPCTLDEHPADEIGVSLPIYWDAGKKIVLVGMNWYRNAHFILQNKCKTDYHEEVWAQLKQVGISSMATCEVVSVSVEYELWYKMVTCDMMNIVSCLDKFLLDALKGYGLIVDDNVLYYRSMRAKVAGMDKENPRLKAYVKFHKKKKERSHE
jgi:hypothetical protein